MSQPTLNIQPGMKVVKTSYLEGMPPAPGDVSVYTVSSLTCEDGDGIQVSFDNPSLGPNGQNLTACFTMSKIMESYKVLTPQEWVAWKSGKLPDNFWDTLEAYPQTETGTAPGLIAEPAVKTAGFMGLPKLFWYVAGGLAIYYIAKRNKMI